MSSLVKYKSSEVIDRINQILIDAIGPLSSHDFKIRRLFSDAKASIAANPTDGHVALGCVYQLVGDFEQASYHFKNSMSLSPNAAELEHNYCALLGNYGYFSDAQKQFARSADPEFGFMTLAWSSGYSCGAFETMSAFIAKAETMQLDLSGIDIETAKAACTVLSKSGLTEQSVGEVLDVAGGVLRDNSLFYIGSTPDITVFDEEGESPFIQIVYKVGVPTSKAVDLYFEFVDRMTNHFSQVPSALSVSYASTLNDARIAA